MNLKGNTLIILAAFFYGINVIISKIAYIEGASPMLVLAMRFLIASVLLWAYGLSIKGKNKLRATKAQLKPLLLIGSIVYAGFSMFYFNSINYIPVSLASVIFYLYPVIVNLFMAKIMKEKIVPKQAAALVMATLGCIFMVWSPVTHLNTFGVLLAFGACMSFSTYLILLDSSFSKELSSLDSLTVTTYITTAASITLLAVAVATKSFDASVTPKGWVAILASAFFSTFLSNILFFAGVRQVGSSRTAILSTFEPVVSVALGVILLKETLVLIQLTGIVMIIVAVVMINMLKA